MTPIRDLGAHVLRWSRTGVELGHEFAVCRTGSGQFVGALLQLEAKLEDLLFAVGERRVQRAKVVWSAEAAVAEGELPTTTCSS